MTDPRVGALGPFFAFETHDEDTPPADGWRTMDELARDPAVLTARVTAVRDHLAAARGRPPLTVESRVAASVTHLGLTARLVSPVLGLTALCGRPPRLALARMRWRPVLGGVFPMSLPREPPHGRPSEALPADLARDFVDGPVRELVEATASLSVSRRVLWGNVASAINGAVAAATYADPASGGRLREAAALLLDHDDLRDTHTGTAGTGRFRRRSCCLIYRAAPIAAGSLCGDCVLGGA